MGKDKDKKIENHIEQVLTARILRSADLNYEVADGIVSLQGMVDVLAEKWLAEEEIRKIPGVVNIDNGLTVVMDREVSDKQIAANLKDKLEQDPRIDMHQVQVEVSDGAVRIQGNVGTIAEANAAQEAAAREYGVKDVINAISIGKGDFKQDEASITNAVELALSRNAAVEASDIHTESFGNKVRLWGTVDTLEQIENVERIVSQVPGVKKIQNELTSRHGQTGEDINLTNELKSRLGQNGLGSVRGYVLDGTVFLHGWVDTPDQRHRAQETASQIVGINNINNGIEIKQ